MLSNRITTSEIKPQQQADRPRRGRAGRQPISGRVDRGPKTGDRHMIQRVIGAEPELQLPPGFAETKGAIQRRVHRRWNETRESYLARHCRTLLAAGVVNAAEIEVRISRRRSEAQLLRPGYPRERQAAGVRKIARTRRP